MTLRANRKQCFSVIELKVVFYQGIILSDAAVCIICACHFIPLAPSQPYVLPYRRIARFEAFISLAFGRKVAPAVEHNQQL